MLQDVIAEEVKDMRWGQFKSTLADAVVAHLEPIQQRYHEVIADKSYLDQVMLAASVLCIGPKQDTRKLNMCIVLMKTMRPNATACVSPRCIYHVYLCLCSDANKRNTYQGFWWPLQQLTPKFATCQTMHRCTVTGFTVF